MKMKFIHQHLNFLNTFTSTKNNNVKVFLRKFKINFSRFYYGCNLPITTDCNHIFLMTHEKLYVSFDSCTYLIR